MRIKTEDIPWNARKLRRKRDLYKRKYFVRVCWSAYYFPGSIYTKQASATTQI